MARLFLHKTFGTCSGKSFVTFSRHKQGKLIFGMQARAEHRHQGFYPLTDPFTEHLPTYLSTYLPACLPANPPFLLACLPACLPTYLPSHPPTYTVTQEVLGFVWLAATHQLTPHRKSNDLARAKGLGSAMQCHRTRTAKNGRAWCKMWWTHTWLHILADAILLEFRAPGRPAELGDHLISKRGCHRIGGQSPWLSSRVGGREASTAAKTSAPKQSTSKWSWPCSGPRLRQGEQQL